MNDPNPNLAIVAAVRAQGMSVSAAARRFRRSRQWIYTLLNRYDTGGADAVLPRSKAPKTRPHAVTDEVKATITALRRELVRAGADAGPATIAWHLNNRGIPAPAESTIRRILTDAGLVTPQPRKRPKASYIRFQASLPNECWQADVTTVALAHGTAEVLDFLDDHSRFLLCLTAFDHVTGKNVVDTAKGLIETFGAPQSSLTDNALVFTTRLAGARGGRGGYEKLLDAHDIRQKNGRANHPQTQGKIERFHQTLKRWLAARERPQTISELQELLDEFRDWYNTERAHRAVGRRTPITAYQALPKAVPLPLTDEDNRLRRDKVDKAGRATLRFAGTLRYLGIGRRWKGHRVLIVVSGSRSTVSLAATGEVIAVHEIDQTIRYQRNLIDLIDWNNPDPEQT
ncbi:IS481 family transposase [Corynebacterium frankenforstense]